MQLTAGARVTMVTCSPIGALQSEAEGLRVLPTARHLSGDVAGLAECSALDSTVLGRAGTAATLKPQGPRLPGQRTRTHRRA